MAETLSGYKPEVNGLHANVEAALPQQRLESGPEMVEFQVFPRLSPEDLILATTDSKEMDLIATRMAELGIPAY